MRENVKIILLTAFIIGFFIVPVFAQSDEIPDESLSIEYTLRGGSVKNVQFDQNKFSVIVSIESPDEGTISFKIPRELIDAKKPAGQDEAFIILIDNFQIPYVETETNSNFRFITTSFEKGDSEIQLIGTHLLGKSYLIHLGGQVTVSSNTNTTDGIFETSSFRIIPDKPNVGGTIRVTGDNFGASQEFKFYINSKKLGFFDTNSDNHFMTTFQIPEDQKAERVVFLVKDKTGDTKEISIVLGNSGTNPPSGNIEKLTISAIPEILYRGDYLEISGTSQPGSSITALVKNEYNGLIHNRTAEVSTKGTWMLSEPISIPLDFSLGTYRIEISNGQESIVKTWNVESTRIIEVTPDNLESKINEIIEKPLDSVQEPQLDPELQLDPEPIPKTTQPQNSESSDGGCLIATAAYGSELAPQVQQLRELRDNHLLHTDSGSAFMISFNGFYYSFSPIIADYERENPVFREAVKMAITPMISSLSILNHVEMDSESKVLGYGLSLILLNVGMYIGIPVAGVYLVKFRAKRE